MKKELLIAALKGPAVPPAKGIDGSGWSIILNIITTYEQLVQGLNDKYQE